MNRYQLIILLISSFVSLSAYSGTNCGSNSGVGLVYTNTSSDWWPDLRMALITSLVGVPVTPATAAFCSATQGQAYFGVGCLWHDRCYTGEVGLGMNKTECDIELLNQWRTSCNNKYKTNSWWDSGQKFCREACESTAEAMYHVLTTSTAAWDNAQAKRDDNIRSAINAIYMQVIGRNATAEELQIAKDYLSGTKSIEGLKQKIKEDYERMQPSIMTQIINLLLE